MEKNKLPFNQRVRLFQKGAILIAAAFGIVMVVVTVIAFSRTSGATGLDVVKMHNLRLEAKSKEIAQED